MMLSQGFSTTILSLFFLSEGTTALSIVLENGLPAPPIVFVQKRSTLQLTCESDSAYATFKWTSDLKEFVPQSGATLSIPNIQPSQSGIYHCNVFDAVANVTVKVRAQSQMQQSQMGVREPFSFPRSSAMPPPHCSIRECRKLTVRDETGCENDDTNNNFLMAILVLGWSLSTGLFIAHLVLCLRKRRVCRRSEVKEEHSKPDEKVLNQLGRTRKQNVTQRPAMPNPREKSIHIYLEPDGYSEGRMGDKPDSGHPLSVDREGYLKPLPGKDQGLGTGSNVESTEREKSDGDYCYVAPAPL